MSATEEMAFYISDMNVCVKTSLRNSSKGEEKLL